MSDSLRQFRIQQTTAILRTYLQAFTDKKIMPLPSMSESIAEVIAEIWNPQSEQVQGR